MGFLKNRRFQLESLEERTLLTAAPWSTADDATKLMVTTLDDVVDFADEVVSIREALASASELDEAATITFADGLSGTITLAGSALEVSPAYGLTIDGGGNITVDAAGNSQIFDIKSGEVTLKGLTLSNGYAAQYGGAIANAGDLTLDTVTITDSVSDRFGGAVYSAEGSSLNVVNSAFKYNSANTHAGAIFVEKGVSAEISGSTFTDNTAGSYGAALYTWNDSAVNVSNSLFLNNSAPNGTLRNYGGNLNLTNVVISANDQGISADSGAVTTGTNVTLSNNRLSQIRGDEGSVFTLYNSIVYGTNPLNISTDVTVTGDNNLSTVPFGNNFIEYNGGDLFAEDGYTLWGENQAQGAGNAAYNSTEFDAVGNRRDYAGSIDIGAVEQICTAYGTTVTYDAHSHVLVGFDGPVQWARYSENGTKWKYSLSYKKAGTYNFWVTVGDNNGDEEIYYVTGVISPAKLSVDGSVVEVHDYDGTTDADVTVGTVSGILSNDQVTLTAEGVFPSAEPGVYENQVDVTYSISGKDASNYLPADPEKLTGVIIIPETPSLVVTTLEDIVNREDGITSLREAVAYAESLGTQVAVTFAGELEGDLVLTGGAIAVNGETSITIEGDDRITINALGESRVFETSGNVILSHITLVGGYAPRYGGAVYNSGNLTVDGVTIFDSYTGEVTEGVSFGKGGAIYTEPGTSLTVIDSNFIGNASKTHGGAIFVDQEATVNISGSYFTGNGTGSYGSALYVWTNSAASVSNTLFFNNAAPNGTLRNFGGTLDMVNVVIAGNDQGFSASGGAANTATNVTITSNTRSAVRGEDNATFTFYNSILMSDGIVFDLRSGATADGDTNLSTEACGTNSIAYDGGVQQHRVRRSRHEPLLWRHARSGRCRAALLRLRHHPHV